MSSIFLCHKCAGHLTADAGPSVYPCGCASGYVRDWQIPTPASDVRAAQLDACQEWANLYERQGRDPKSAMVMQNNALLAKLSQGDAS